MQPIRANRKTSEPSSPSRPKITLTSRPKIKLFSPENREVKAEPQDAVVTEQTEQERGMKVFEEWMAQTEAEPFTLDFAKMNEEPLLTPEQQQWEIQRGRALEWAVKICLDDMPYLARQQWERDRWQEESLERARRAWAWKAKESSQTFADFSSQQDGYVEIWI
ncbi:hypothetical protein C8R45DRAFT_1101645 [Mycena sanguinolenta]|nr:hypothetical protein C8R45DRAFT_1101645 [Mycena sanguinolenta]